MQKFYLSLFLNLAFFPAICFAQYDRHFGTDTIDFEDPTVLVYIDTNNSGNIWQIGKPKKVVFNTALSGINAIITDTVQMYPKNDTSSFIVVIPRMDYYPQNTFISFTSKWDLENQKDFGFIDYSFYGDSAWRPLNSCNNGQNCNIEESDNIYLEDSFWEQGSQHFTENEDREFLITGNSADWVTFSYRWHWWTPIGIAVEQPEPIQMKTTTYNGYPDSLCIRFTMVSDSVESNNEGWMIDNIIIGYQNFDDVNDIEQNFISIYPNPATNIININLTDYSEVEKLILYTISGQQVKEIPASSNDVSVQAQDLTAGLYMLQLNMKRGNIYTQKIVIQK